MYPTSVILPAGETGRKAVRFAIGAEGATAPETLRQKGRRKMTLWKAVILRI
jgi:hypothetical protein